MKKILGIGLVGVAAFASALAAGWWMNQQSSESPHGETAADDHSEGDQHSTEADVAASSHESHDSQGYRAGSDGDAELPLPIRPRAISTEEIFEIAMRLQEREAAVAQREQHLETRQDQLNLIMDELEREQQEVEGVRAEVRSLLQSGEDLLQQLSAAQLTLTQQEAQIQQLMTDADEAGAAQVVANQQNLQRIADIFKGMEPEEAATQLSSMADSGDIDFVIQVFAQLDERDSAAIGEHIKDPELFTQIITGLRDYEEPAAFAPATR